MPGVGSPPPDERRQRMNGPRGRYRNGTRTKGRREEGMGLQELYTKKKIYYEEPVYYEVDTLGKATNRWKRALLNALMTVGLIILTMLMTQFNGFYFLMLCLYFLPPLVFVGTLVADKLRKVRKKMGNPEKVNRQLRRQNAQRFQQLYAVPARPLRVRILDSLGESLRRGKALLYVSDGQLHMVAADYRRDFGRISLPLAHISQICPLAECGDTVAQLGRPRNAPANATVLLADNGRRRLTLVLPPRALRPLRELLARAA